MKNDPLDEAFIEKCRNIDFSNESTNQEKNLVQLKRKLNEINQEREIVMNKKLRKPLVFAAAAFMLLCFFMVAYGRDIVRIIKVKLGEHVEYEVAEGMGDAASLPPEEIEKMKVPLKNEGVLRKPAPIQAGTQGTPNFHNVEFVKFRDVKEGQSYFVCDTLTPAYLPKGYEFDRIEFYVKSVEEIKLKANEGANKYMSVYYSDGKNEIYSQVRYMDEETAFVGSGANSIKTLTIDGHDAVLTGNGLSVLIGDVMYMFHANDQLNVDELVKIAESLQ